MSNGRTIGAALVLLLVAGVVAGLGAISFVTAQLPAAQGERVRGPYDVVGVQTGGSYAWVVPTKGGVIVIDAGLDTRSTALKAEIGSRSIQAVLLTNAQADHVGGLSGLPDDVPVYVHAQDLALLTGERTSRGWMARAFRTLTGRPEVPKLANTVEDGAILEVDGMRILGTHVPGHSLGSMAWLVEGVLFTGDALLGGSPLVLSPAAFSDDPEQARKSVELLLPLDFDAIADGHVGVTTTARGALHRLVGRKVEPPTLAVRSTGGKTIGAVTERIGTFSQAPIRDDNGEQPSVVVFPDGEHWRWTGAPDPAQAGWSGRKVVARGEVRAASNGVGARVDVLSVALAPDQEAGPRPVIGTAADLAAYEGQWIDVEGTVQNLRPLQPGAAWAEGRLQLADGTSIPLAAPASFGSEHGGVLRLQARVSGRGEAALLVASALAAPVAAPNVE